MIILLIFLSANNFTIEMVYNVTIYGAQIK